jgi:hypothetical protein
MHPICVDDLLMRPPLVAQDGIANALVRLSGYSP